jgi:DNA mismatch endonuclease (patch repair protein)
MTSQPCVSNSDRSFRTRSSSAAMGKSLIRPHQNPLIGGEVDRLSKSQRSQHMARIRSKNTGPELAIRRALFRLGYRFRLHINDLPGTPDIVFRNRRKAVFIHGCFWHAHKGCHLAKIPKTRTEYWRAKFLRNAKRDRSSKRKLRSMGWSTLTIWECQIVREEHVMRRLTRYLGLARIASPDNPP